MICEFRNNLERYVCFILNADPADHVKKETYLSDVLVTILFAIVTTILITWWILPLRLLFKVVGSLNLNRKFVCSKYKEE